MKIKVDKTDIKVNSLEDRSKIRREWKENLKMLLIISLEIDILHSLKLKIILIGKML